MFPNNDGEGKEGNTATSDFETQRVMALPRPALMRGLCQRRAFSSVAAAAGEMPVVERKALLNRLLSTTRRSARLMQVRRRLSDLGQLQNIKEYSAAIVAEWAATQGKKVTGVSADIFKSFGQISRVVLGATLQKAGLPERVRRPHMEFISVLTVRNSISGGLSQEYTRRTGTPQRNAMAMCVSALMFRP